ncbi:MAG TPA: hypothetical protein P5130_05885, partial [Spirochaetota bacterium]|nr:hypothetical protein [Spirochaetota bacterium]
HIQSICFLYHYWHIQSNPHVGRLFDFGWIQPNHRREYIQLLQKVVYTILSMYALQTPIIQNCYYNT